MVETITRYILSDDADGYCQNNTDFYALDEIYGIPLGRISPFSEEEVFDAFVYFDNIQIPDGAEIQSAKITFIAEETLGDDPCNLLIAAEKDGDPSKPTSCATMSGNDTVQTVSWSFTGWTEGGAYDTPDITAIIQEVIDRPEWAIGNPILLYVRENGSGDLGHVDFEGFSGTKYDPALLTITYEYSGILPVMLGSNF